MDACGEMLRIPESKRSVRALAFVLCAQPDAFKALQAHPAIRADSYQAGRGVHWHMEQRLLEADPVELLGEMQAALRLVPADTLPPINKWAGGLPAIARRAGIRSELVVQACVRMAMWVTEPIKVMDACCSAMGMPPAACAHIRSVFHGEALGLRNRMLLSSNI